MKKDHEHIGIIIPMNIQLDPRLNHTSKILAGLIISKYLSDGYVCRIKNEEIGKILNVKQTTISAAITKLKEAGYLKIDRDEFGVRLLYPKSEIIHQTLALMYNLIREYYE